MPVVIADTGPVNYLVLIGHIDVLPILFEAIILPSVVRDELAERNAPAMVRNWIASLPAWVEVRAATLAGNDPGLARLDAGEQAAIALAVECHADLLLMDDRRGVKAARSRGFRVAGTLAILGMAARRDLVDLADALARLQQTSFHYRPEIIRQFLADQRGKP